MEKTPPLTKAQVVALFEAYGGSVKLGRRIGVPTTTADTWRRKKKIPPWRLPFVLKAAEEDGIDFAKRARAA